MIPLLIPFVAVAAAIALYYSRNDETQTVGENVPENSGSTKSLDDLHPWFRARYAKVVERMNRDGYPTKVNATYRSKADQLAAYERGNSKVKQSYHGVEGKDGKRESFAADVQDARYPLEISPGKVHPKQAEYFIKLRNAAREHGIRTGGEFSKTNPDLAQYGLGWDPGHIEPAPESGLTISRLHSGFRPD